MTLLHGTESKCSLRISKMSPLTSLPAFQVHLLSSLRDDTQRVKWLCGSARGYSREPDVSNHHRAFTLPAGTQDREKNGEAMLNWKTDMLAYKKWSSPFPWHTLSSMYWGHCCINIDTPKGSAEAQNVTESFLWKSSCHHYILIRLF